MPTPATRPDSPAKIEGHVDGLDGTSLAGWAYVPEIPSLRVNVQVFERGSLVGSGLAGDLREDVLASGFGDGRSGFTIRLPHALFDGRQHKFTVKCEAPGTTAISQELEMFLPAVGQSVQTIAPGARPETMVDFLYTPGLVVTIPPGHLLPAYFRKGWHPPVEGLVWIDGAEGSLEFMIRKPADAYFLTLEVVPNVGESAPQQVLEVYFNGFRVGGFELERRTLLTVRLPAELFILRTARLDFHCPSPVVGPLGGALAGKRLGTALFSWCIG